MKTIKIVLCQINPTVGDLRGNSRKILDFYRRAVSRHDPDLVVFPECALAGYPAEDLLLKPIFLKENASSIQKIARTIQSPPAIVGFVHTQGKNVYNSAAVLGRSRIQMIYSKQSLPNYGVFDEKRYFTPGTRDGIFYIKGIPVGLSICEDIWQEGANNPCLRQSKMGARILINVSASPYHAGKLKDRLSLFRKRIRQTKTPLVYVNLVGGQDELLFDGRSLVLGADGNLKLLAQSFAEDTQCSVFECSESGRLEPVSGPDNRNKTMGKIEEIYEALVLGTRDYMEKNGFQTAIVGLSGGIDSALTACIAQDALGKERVWGVTMPTRYTSKGTYRDAVRLSQNCGIRILKIPIEKIFKSYLESLSPVFRGARPDVTEENLQPRIRGNILMALSNKFHGLVLTTGNKSEISVGYCTLYGDTAGGFAVLKDVPKTLVYQLARYANVKDGKNRIPESTIRRAPTAELKKNQKDQDTLPPYDLLDTIIQRYIEEDKSVPDLIRYGFDKPTLTRVLRMIDRNEYKRRQSPPGIKITPKSFGKDRRMPLTNRFHEF
ncbi:MAG: NAD+ synthase [Elusimicrobia bacterium]|nr:NAD+ synthase [Elusimicrobiota bacterium]